MSYVYCVLHDATGGAPSSRAGGCCVGRSPYGALRLDELLDEDDEEYGSASLGLASGCRAYRGERGATMQENGLLDAQVQVQSSRDGDLD